MEILKESKPMITLNYYMVHFLYFILIFFVGSS